MKYSLLGAVSAALLVSVSQTAWASSEVRLLGQTIDTSTVAAKSRQTGRRADKFSAGAQTQGLSARGTLPYLVQLSGPIREEWKAALSATGAVIKGYVPENAFIVEINPGKLDSISGIAAVQWIGEYQAAYKIQPRLKSLAGDRALGAKGAGLGARPAAAGSQTASPDVVVVTISTFAPDDVGRVEQAVLAGGGQVLRAAKGARRGLIRAQIAIEAVETLSALGEVEWIEEYVPNELHNNVAAEAPRMNVAVVWTNYGLTGAGQVVAVADTGLDTGDLGTIHPDFTNRVLATYALGRPGDWSDPDGHGTHTSGSVLGDGSAYSNGLFHGVAYGAQLVMQSVMDSGGGLGGLPANLNDLFIQAYTNNARIHSDSWGSSLNGYYSTDCENTDEFMWNHPDMLVVFSAGNDGRDGDRDGVVDLHRVGSPGTSKNILTVGASESQRPSGSGGYSSYVWGTGSWAYYYPVAPISSDLISTSADGVNQGMAAFSSRGPCNDGRIKPDIVAPGTDIISCRSHAPGAGTGWGTGSGVLGDSSSSNYVFSGGTSMSTPLTAGAAALARQYLMERRGFTNPCAALIKATLINGARSLTPGQYGTGATREVPPAPRPNNVEGWGQVNLADSLFPGAGNTNIFFDSTNSLTTGSTNIHTFEVTSTNRLSITLAWTDYPATLAAALKLVNDLDLLAILPDGTTNYAFGRSDFDRINNVEGLDLDPAPQGTLTVKVIGYSVPSGPQPYALVLRTSATLSLAKATSPAPANGETGVSRSARLSWGNAGGATGFMVYFGTNAAPGPSEFRGAQDATWFNPGSLDYRKTYYWRVDATNASGTVTGDVWSFTTEARVVLSENFEHGGAIPSGWTNTRISGARDWVFISGGWPGYYCPSYAHSGSYNACLYYSSGYDMRTMLVSPPINFGTLTNNAELTFWHCAEDYKDPYFGTIYQDYLRVYYRTNSTAGWTSLSNYLNCATTWTKRTISLPVTGTNLFIAFEGDANGGNGVCIDDVEVTGMRYIPAAPTGVTASAGAYTNKVQVTWTAVDNADGYIVWSNTVNSTSSATIAISGVSTTTWDDTNSSVGIPAYYWVQATNDAGAGEWSSPAAVGWRTGDASISILGTNGIAVTNGEPANAGKGTDFGFQHADGNRHTNTFSITNSGSAALQIIGVTTNGTGAAFFNAARMPSTVAAGSASNFDIVFIGATVGWHTTVVTIANTSTNTPYFFNLSGACGGAIGLSTTALAFAGAYGGTAPENTFIISNSNPIAFNFTNAVTYGQEASGWLSMSPATGSVSGDGAQIVTGAVTIGSLNAGVYTATNTITATNALNSPQDVVVTLTVSKANQAISFANPGAQIATNTVGLSATSSASLAVSFQVGAGLAHITGGTNLSFTGAGAVSIIASQAGNTNWNAAPNITNTFNVTKANQSILFPSIPEQTTTSLVTLAATADSGLPVSFYVLSGPGSINGGILSFSGVGLVQIVASQDGNALWNAAANFTNSITVRDVSILAAPQNLAASDGTYTDKVAVTWSATPGAGGYQVWRSAANNLAAAVNLGNAGLPSYNDNSTAVRSATMFYYWVKAFNNITTSAFSAVDSGFCRSSENPEIIGGQPMVGDYDGDNKADPAVYNLANGRLFVWLSAAAYTLVTPVATFQMAAGDLPVAGDFDGDKLADPGTFRRQTGAWHIWLSSAGYYRVGPLSFGIDMNDAPIPADYDGDRLTDPAVCNAGAAWYVWLSSAGYYRVGPLTIFRVNASDEPMAGLFDADLLADPAVYQALSGNWYVWLSSAGYYRVGPIPLGTTGEHLAVPADYDGDGLCDPAAYIPTNGVWRIWESGNGYALKELPLR